MKTFSLVSVLALLCIPVIFPQNPVKGENPGCTVFTVSKGDKVFFGGNDDYINPDSYYWTDPGGSTGYGAIWVGEPDNVQQGVNEKGLAYDANGLPRVSVNPHSERLPSDVDYTGYPVRILRECATVEEVLRWINTHRWRAYMHDQMHFADATGDAVIVSAGTDGELVFTRKPAGDGFLISTNFNVADHTNGSFPCSRYETAQDMLSRIIENGDELSLLDAVNVLDAVHMEGPSSWTIESMAADLREGTVYLYYYHQFDKPVVLKVREEIAGMRPDGPLSGLFPEDVRGEASRRYNSFMEVRETFGGIGKFWFALWGAGIVIILFFSKDRKNLVFWIPVCLILGPLGFIIWLAAGYEKSDSLRKKILVEAAGDLMAPVSAFAAALFALFIIPGALESQGIQALLFFGLPLFAGWVVFNGLLLPFAVKEGRMGIVIKRIPHTWAAVTLGVSFIFFAGTYTATSGLMLPIPFWVALSWWGVTVIFSLPALLLLYLFNGWAVRRGYLGWSVLAGYGGNVNPAPWGRLWWWILVSYAALAVSFIIMNLIRQG